jgi:hypothetical protein
MGRLKERAMSSSVSGSTKAATHCTAVIGMTNTHPITPMANSTVITSQTTLRTWDTLEVYAPIAPTLLLCSTGHFIRMTKSPRTMSDAPNPLVKLSGATGVLNQP